MGGNSIIKVQADVQVIRLAPRSADPSVLSRGADALLTWASPVTQKAAPYVPNLMLLKSRREYV